MSSSNARPAPDAALTAIADYVAGYVVDNPGAYRIARYSLIDTLGCAVEALNFPECVKLLGPAFPGMSVAGGARVPGTPFELDPVSAAFNLATMIRWIDYNDSLSTDQGGHPSDNLGGILTVADYVSRRRKAEGGISITMREVLTALIKSYEIQGVLSLGNNFVRVGYDYVILPKVALTAVVAQMLGASRDQIVNAVSNAWADGVPLTIYRQGDNTGPRMNWAGGDAAARAVQHAFMALKGELGYPSALTAKTYGFHDAFFKGQPLRFVRPYGDYVMEHLINFKLIPASVQAQSAGDCAYRLHPLVRDRLEDIERITVRSHERMIRGLDKKGPLTNPADRGHCVQYVIAVLLIHGSIGATDFDDAFAADQRIDRLRAKMTVVEEPQFTKDFLDPEKRSNTQAIQVSYRDGSSTPEVVVEYPLGYPPLREEALQRVEEKFRAHLKGRYTGAQQDAILELCLDQARLERTPVEVFIDRLVV
jgi:2-methylcitrate dehydratase